ncbi:cytochrome P450 [Streptomyces olivoreticuli]|uniref:cytochrome P450 family protein n=1 Tax=Streptomyces olivoreticuli TaxID=68246 RepID=UPI0026591AC5|nr:cytochrome P450 [Streptomyces olivoreticuli]WKK23947.1 cytochrome P450 [Streptomyces olivoreticuli]
MADDRPLTPAPLDASGTLLHQQTAQLRARGPATRVTLPGNLTAWSVTRGDVLRRLLTHPHVARDARYNWPGYQPGTIPWLSPWIDVVSMSTTDGADHRRLRALVSQAFTPRRAESLQPHVHAVVTDLLDDLAGLPPHSVVDLREHYCRRIPGQVICDLFGVHDHQRTRLLHALDTLPSTAENPELAANTLQEIYATLEDVIAAKKTAPGPDMTSALLAAHTEDDDRLSHQELICTIFVMIGAGTDTVTAHLDHAVHALLTHPEQHAAVLRDPSRWGDVIEELLRLQGPIVHLPLRFVTADIHLDEQTTLRAGDLLLPCFGAHGRDPEVHERPDVFDMDRPDKQHLAFGYGGHFCLGARLARIEAVIAMRALFARFPHLALAAEPGGPEPVPSFIVNDYRALPVVLGDTRPKTEASAHAIVQPDGALTPGGSSAAKVIT